MRYPEPIGPTYDGDSYHQGWNDAIKETREMNEREGVERDIEISTCLSVTKRYPERCGAGSPSTRTCCVL